MIVFVRLAYLRMAKPLGGRLFSNFNERSIPVTQSNHYMYDTN